MKKKMEMIYFNKFQMDKKFRISKFVEITLKFIWLQTLILFNFLKI